MDLWTVRTCRNGDASTLSLWSEIQKKEKKTINIIGNQSSLQFMRNRTKQVISVSFCLRSSGEKRRGPRLYKTEMWERERDTSRETGVAEREEDKIEAHQ